LLVGVDEARFGVVGDLEIEEGAEFAA